MAPKSPLMSSIDQWGRRLVDRKDKAAAWMVACCLLVAETALGLAIIRYIPYTKIDWDAYMSQVDGFLAGERDYSQLQGDTGPLVYPAGFLYAFTALKWVTGGEVLSGQYVFLLLYLLNLAIVLAIYIRAELLPPLALPLLCVSKRLHSIFLLRLFNDCIAMLLLHLALLLLQAHAWLPAMLAFSAGVSVKMNVLLFLPPLLLILAKACSLPFIIFLLASAGGLQVLIGWPFLAYNATSYLSRSFELSRVFIHHWSVNFKFIPEDVFVSKPFASSLLLLHLALLFLFGHYRWAREDGGLFSVAWQMISSPFRHTQRKDASSSSLELTPFYIASIMFTGNFIGIVCARSLHYQFYSWYFCSVPFLLWLTPYSVPVRLFLLFNIEVMWNIFPSTLASSAILLASHMIVLVGLWLGFDGKKLKYE